MQDKIQEIMGLVDEYNNYGTTQDLYAIESKLRELVREPLSDDAIATILDNREDIAERADGGGWHLLPYAFARAIERAHNITNTSN